MCGIASILLHPQERSPESWTAIRDNFTQNLLINQERGKSATGLAVIQADGQALVLKLPIPAADFVATPQYKALLDRLNSETVLLLGHTRRPTKGTPAHNDNNHPLEAGPVLGIHNGHINNDDEIFAHCHCPRRAEVDSEIIFRLLEPLSPRDLGQGYLQAVHTQLQQLEGQFTFLSANRHAPEKLLVVKHQKPLSLHYHPAWNVLIFSSRYIFLRKAFGPVLLTEELPRDRLLLFDAYALPQHRHEAVESLPLVLAPAPQSA